MFNWSYGGEVLNTDLGIFGIGDWMVKVKTSIYVDKDLWERFKLNVARRGLDVSGVLEGLIREELIEDVFDESFRELLEDRSYEVDFEPVKPRVGLVSALVRELRDERADSLSRLE